MWSLRYSSSYLTCRKDCRSRRRKSAYQAVMDEMGPTIQKLYETLTGIQMGRIEALRAGFIQDRFNYNQIRLKVLRDYFIRSECTLCVLTEFGWLWSNKLGCLVGKDLRRLIVPLMFEQLLAVACRTCCNQHKTPPLAYGYPSPGEEAGSCRSCTLLIISTGLSYRLWQVTCDRMALVVCSQYIGKRPGMMKTRRSGAQL